MALQRNVAQQAEVTMAAIRRAAEIGRAQLPWLRAVLSKIGVASAGGILVSYSEVPEQGGIFSKGKWLAADGRFWEFEALLSHRGGELLEVEHCHNITASLPVNASVPGIGPTFAYLALEVLHEQRGA